MGERVAGGRVMGRFMESPDLQFWTRMGAMNPIVLVLVLVLETKRTNRGRERRGGRFTESERMLFQGGSCLGPFIDSVNALFGRFRVR